MAWPKVARQIQSAFSSPLSCWGGEQRNGGYIPSCVAAHSKFSDFPRLPNRLVITAYLAHYLGTQNGQVVVPIALQIKGSI